MYLAGVCSSLDINIGGILLTLHADDLANHQNASTQCPWHFDDAARQLCDRQPHDSTLHCSPSKRARFLAYCVLLASLMRPALFTKGSHTVLEDFSLTSSRSAATTSTCSQQCPVSVVNAAAGMQVASLASLYSLEARACGRAGQTFFRTKDTKPLSSEGRKQVSSRILVAARNETPHPAPWSSPNPTREVGMVTVTPGFITQHTKT